MPDQEISSTPNEGSVAAEGAAPAAAPAVTTPEPATGLSSIPKTPPAAESATAADPKAVSPAKEGEIEKPSFVPKEKFKAWRAEHEVPKWVRDIVKDADTETKAIELLEKASGLDLMKPKFEETKASLQQVTGQHQTMLGQINDLRQTYQRGDIDLWLQKLQIPQERMLQWALDKVNLSQLSPDQQRLHEQKVEAERKAITLEERNHQYESQVYESQRQAKSMQLESGLARPEVQTFVEAFDSRAGRPGAFRQEVISTGEAEYLRSQGKVDLSPDQAIAMVLDRYKNFVTIAAPATLPGSAAAPGPKVIMPGEGAPTIPNVAGRAASPLKSSPNSLDDLRKLSKEFQARA